MDAAADLIGKAGLQEQSAHAAGTACKKHSTDIAWDVHRPPALAALAAGNPLPTSPYVEKDKLYQGAVSTPAGRKFVWAKTEAERIKKVRDMQRNVDQGLPATPSRQTLAEFLAWAIPTSPLP